MTNTVTYPTATQTWVNSDGLPIRFGKGNQVDAIVGVPSTLGVDKVIEVEMPWDRLPAFSANEATGQLLGGYPNTAIPAGALIKSAVWQATTAYTGATATVSIGLVSADGLTEIDNDGLFDALTVASLDTVGESNVGAGALIGTKLATTGYLWVSVQTASFTAGNGRLTITYYMPGSTANNT